VSGTFELGLRAGAAIATGTLAERQGATTLLFPLRIHAGYRISPQLFFVGGYVQAGALQCRQCAVDARVGGEAHYHPLGSNGIDPWVGAGIGYDVVFLAFSDGITAKSGIVLDVLQLGVSFRTSRSTRLGPFVGLSLTFLNGPLSLDAQPELPAVNVWSGAGLILTFGP
jgi:hypothetical protein